MNPGSKPVAYRQFEPFVRQITGDVCMRATQRRDNGTVELIIEDNHGIPRQLPDDLELVHCDDGSSLPAQNRGYIHKECVYNLCKNTQYVVREMSTGKILCQLVFKWDVRRL